MDKLIQQVFFKSWEVIGNLLSLAHDKRVVAMGEDDGRELLFIGEKVAAMDTCDGHLVLTPLGFAGRERKGLIVDEDKLGGCLTSGIVQ